MTGNRQKTVVVIVGPTASGKSQLALDLAKEYQGIIINADSLQLYRGLPILSAQPSSQDLEEVQHHLYGFLNSQEQGNAVLWIDQVIKLLQQPELAHKLPVLVGGTGFYIKGLIEGFSPIPPSCPHVRTQSLERFHHLGLEKFIREVAQFDPVILLRLNINDKQRLMRAWEVYHSTGRPLSFWQSLPKDCRTRNYRFVTFFLNPLRTELKKYADQRLEKMLAQGALSEIQALKETGIPKTAPIYKTLGARPLTEYITGKLSLEQAITSTQTATHQYIKRQQTWFQHQLSDFYQINQFYSKDTLRSVQSVLKDFIP